MDRRRAWTLVAVLGLVAAIVLALVWLQSRPAPKQPVDVPTTTVTPVTSTTLGTPARTVTPVTSTTPDTPATTLTPVTSMTPDTPATTVVPAEQGRLGLLRTGT